MLILLKNLDQFDHYLKVLRATVLGILDLFNTVAFLEEQLTVGSKILI
jgi:hypothetical protein